jgi:hypothetical protein
MPVAVRALAGALLLATAVESLHLATSLLDGLGGGLHVDSRLWLDGVIGALTVGALSAAIVFAAVKASTGGDTAAVATNLAYPLGDMILIGLVIGAMTAGRGRLDRTWLCFGAGVGVFAVADSV